MSFEFGYRLKTEIIRLSIFAKRALVSCNLGISRVPQRHHHNRVLVLGVEKVQGVSLRPVVVEHGAQIVSGRQVKVSQKSQWSPKIRGEDGERLVWSWSPLDVK